MLRPTVESRVLDLDGLIDTSGDEVGGPTRILRPDSGVEASLGLGHAFGLGRDLNVELVGRHSDYSFQES